MSPASPRAAPSGEAFVPAAGLRSPHAQTIFAALFRPSHAPPIHRERWELPDGDFVDVDRIEASPDAPHLLVLHGLEGSSRSGYVLATLRLARARGWGALALNFRSCSGELNRLPRFYHSGETGDARLVLERMREQVRGPLLGIGFSLGGNVLLRLLGEEGDRCLLQAAAAVSVPYDLQRSARSIDGAGGLTRIYRDRFLRTLLEKALAKAACHPGALDPSRLGEVRTIEEFDDRVTAPLHGFPSAQEYYRACSSAAVLGSIAVTTLLLSALDDPMVPGDTLPESAAKNERLRIVRTERGGHVGFVAGSLFRPRFWAEERAMEFLAERLDVGAPR